MNVGVKSTKHQFLQNAHIQDQDNIEWILLFSYFVFILHDLHSSFFPFMRSSDNKVNHLLID